jgi:hypothetical protein
LKVSQAKRAKYGDFAKYVIFTVVDKKETIPIAK